MPRRTAVYQRCEGEAHSNAHIDNCMQCAPHWGYWYACPSCSMRLDDKNRCRNPDCLSSGQSFHVPL